VGRREHRPNDHGGQISFFSRAERRDIIPAIHGIELTGNKLSTLLKATEKHLSHSFLTGGDDAR
jgi:hypothetical protein